MNGSIPIPYAIGSKAWLARVATETAWVTCPACNGTLRHVVTMGNGETHPVWCSECGADRRYDYDHALDRDGPVGQVRAYPVRVEVAEVTLASVEVRGDEVSYYSESDGRSRYVYDAKTLFATEAEARAYAEAVLAPKAQAVEDDRLASYVAPGRRTRRAEEAARHAAFWLRHRKEHADRLAAIDRRIARLKEPKS